MRPSILLHSVPDWLKNFAPGFQPIAVSTLKTNKSFGRTNYLRRTSSEKTGETNFQTNKPSEFVRLFVLLKRRLLEDDLSIQTNKSTKARPESTLAEQIVRQFVHPDDLFVSSLKTANDKQNQNQNQSHLAFTRDFSHALNKLQVMARNSHWFIALFAPLVIGRSNSFGIGLSTVLWNTLYVLTTGTYFKNLILKRSSCSVTLTRWYSYVIDGIRGR